MATGEVKFFNDTKGFGFITPDAGGKDVFVHRTGTKVDLYEGDKVQYDLEQTDRGPSAINVTKI
ncbi:MAG TPA: cold-shock protein [Cyclobacteriaceae bacterium]|nr:cold-shock protein [Cyclobacteriaceae bacterium]